MFTALIAVVLATVFLGVAGNLVANWIPPKWSVWAFVLLLLAGAYFQWVHEGTAAVDARGVSGKQGIVPGAAPYKIRTCESLTQSYGAWTPSPATLRESAQLAATGVCYNYFEFDPDRFAKTFEQCAHHLKTGTVRLAVDASEGWCELEIRSASQGSRTWLRFESVYVRGAQIGNQTDIFEVVRGKPGLYAAHWQCDANREGAMRSSTPPGNTNGYSPKMRDDWPALPPELRGFFCTGKLVGDDLSQP